MERNFSAQDNLNFIYQQRVIDMVDAGLVQISYDSNRFQLLLQFATYVDAENVQLAFNGVSLFQWIPKGILKISDYHRLDGCGYQSLWSIENGDDPAITPESSIHDFTDNALVLIFEDLVLRLYARSCLLSLPAIQRSQDEL